MVYQRILSNNEFRPVTWAAVYCKETRETYRVNGKHTSIMLSGMEDIPEFFVTVERYECDTLHDVASLYNTFDSRLGSRSAHDLNLAFAATMPELAGIQKRFIHYVVTAASYAKWGESYSAVPPQERAELLLDHGEFVAWLSEMFIADKRHKHIQRGPVVCAMLATWYKAKSPSTEFWSLVRDESHHDKDHPSRTLARYLARVNIASGRGSAPGRTMAGARELYVKSIHAWNAFRRGSTTDLKYHASAKVPAVV
jgi:hypothetical protein